MSGKGSKRRPQFVPDKHVSSEWERIFSSKKKSKNLKKSNNK